MINETKKNIEAYKALLPGLKERVAAVALMLVMSVVMMTSATYAWLTISRAPEVQGMNTTITGNGNLEIALANGTLTAPGVSQVGDSSASQDLLDANITWGNLVNLSDSRYGLDQISLRPALLSDYNRDKTPLYGASYGEDGRVDSTSDRYGYASYTQIEGTNRYYFAAGSAVKYGVRAIASVKYSNATGNAVVEAMWGRITDSYASAWGNYENLILNKTLVSSENSVVKVYSMDALSDLMQIYVQEKADTMLGNSTNADYSGVVTYTYRLMEAFQDVLEYEGKALLYMANLQIYMSDNTLGTEYYKTLADLLTAYNGKKLHTALYKDGVLQISSLPKFAANYSDLQKSLTGLSDEATACDPDTVTDPPHVAWSAISTDVQRLVNIYTTEIEGMQVGTLSRGDLDGLIDIFTANSKKNMSEVIIHDGILCDTEERIGAGLAKNDIWVSIYLKVKYSFINLDKDVYAYVKTDVNPLNTTKFAADCTTTSSMENTSTGGDAEANDTYGMALDMWVRTNVSGTVLTLEGSLKTEMVNATCFNKNGVETELFTLSYKGETSNSVTAYMLEEENLKNYYNVDTNVLIGNDKELTSSNGYTITEGEKVTLEDNTEVQLYIVTHTSNTTTSYNAYKMTENGTESWYNADNHTVIVSVADANAADSGYSAVNQQTEMVTGYDGVNRVWEEYLSLIENGYMAENNTTQGAGSCYVFYAEPSDQSRILNLLQAFTVVFVDQSGNTYGTAKLDTEHYYSINGKVTVPLKMITGTTYTDENGNEQTGIVALAKNQATWISAIIYLDGMRLTNQDVLAVGEIEGSLNIQFGSSVALGSEQEEDLMSQYRDVSASLTPVTSGGSTLNNGVSYKFDGNAKEVTVTVKVTGNEQPRNVKAFFVRYISATQGTRGETVAFTNAGNGNWTATFKLTNSGTYVMRNVIVDGADMALSDGSYPTVEITGLGLGGVSCDLASGVTMTADDYVEAPVRVTVSASEGLAPKQVRALFRAADGSEFTAILSNDYDDVWTGSARITESGTYTLEYVVIDGQYYEIPESQRSTHIIYLGLVAMVWTDLPVADRSFVFTGDKNVNLQAKVYDSNGDEVLGLSNMKLFYRDSASVIDQDGYDTDMTWNASTGYYEGKIVISGPGEFVFNRVTVVNNGATSTIDKASVSPVFTAIPSVPPTFDSETTAESIFAPNGDAQMTVVLADSGGAAVWAKITNNFGDAFIVEGVATNLGDGTYRYAFLLPDNTDTNTQDGDWELEAIYMQGVYIESAGADGTVTGKMYSKTGVAPSLVESDENYCEGDDYYSLPITAGVEIKTHVIETVNVSVSASGDKDFSGTFLQEFTPGNVTVTFTDWADDPIADIESILWTLTYDGKSSEYGSYTGAIMSPNGITVEKDANNPGVFVVTGQKLPYAGEYSTLLKYSGGGVTNQAATVKEEQVVKYTVTTSSPTVTISGVSSNASTDRYYLSSTPSSLNVITGSFNKKVDDYNAVVYMYVSAQTGTLDQEQVAIKYPTVTLSLSGVPSNHGGVTMVFPGVNNTNSTFTFAAGKTTASSTIGSGTDGVFNEGLLGLGASVDTWPVFYPAGKQTVSQIEVTYGGVVYTVNLGQGVTINNPQHQPFVDFKDITSIQSSFTGTTPSRIYATTVGVDTFQITLPGSQTWTEAKSSTTNGDFVVQSGYPSTRKVYRTWTEGALWWKTTYYEGYTETTTVSKASSSTTTWTRTWTITGWKVGDTTYLPGETITITGNQTITAVLGYTDGAKTTTTTTTTRTEIKYTDATGSQTTNPGGTDIGTGSSAPQDSTTETVG